MVQQNIPTVLRIDRDRLRPPISLPRVPPQPELNDFLSLFTDYDFTGASTDSDSTGASTDADSTGAVGPANTLGAWNEPVIQDLDNEHQFEGPNPWGIDADRPSDSLWRVYCEFLSRRYPNRYPLIISNPISLDDLPATFLTPEIRQRLPQCSNLLFILRNSLHEYWFGDLNFQTTTLHILTPWPAGEVGVPDNLSAQGALEQCLRVATRDPTCRINLAQGYNVSTPPQGIERSWRYALRAMALWHESRDPDHFWPNPVTPIDSAGWGMPGFMGGLIDTLYQVSGIKYVCYRYSLGRSSNKTRIPKVPHSNFTQPEQRKCQRRCQTRLNSCSYSSLVTSELSSLPNGRSIMAPKQSCFEVYQTHGMMNVIPEETGLVQSK